MYYHQIDFATQSRFFFITLLSGIAVGFISLLMCSDAYSKKTQFLLDILFSLFACGVFVCVNIVYLDAAMRFYQLLTYVSAILSVHAALVKITDVYIRSFLNFFKQHLFFSLKRKCKRFLNKANLLLKKVRSLLYNFLSNLKEHFSEDGKGATRKKKKKKTQSSKEAAS